MTCVAQDHRTDRGLPEGKFYRAPPSSRTLRRDTIGLKRPTAATELHPNIGFKSVTATCAADGYNLEEAGRLLRRAGYRIDNGDKSWHGQVLHVLPQAAMLVKPEQVKSKSTEGEIFVFHSGTVVAWDTQKELIAEAVTQILPHAADHGSSLPSESERMSYIEDAATATSQVVGEIIVIGYTPPSATAPELPDSSSDSASDATLVKVAFSSALARSTKLAVLEGLLTAYFKSTKDIPATLSAGLPLRYNRRSILRKTGELMSIRAHLNLYSELTDSLPDLFWDARPELGLETCYESLGEALDVGVRIKVLNEKLDYASEIAAVLRERLSEEHSTSLEWLIIGLISIEVAFGVYHLWKESKEQDELSRLRQLLERYLEQEVNKE